MVMFARAAVISLALLFPVQAFAQYGLQDGSFDVQGANLPTYCHLPECPAGAWTGNVNGLVHSGEPDLGSVFAPSSPAMAFIQATGQLSQTFTATTTARVRLVWLEADRPYFGGEPYIVTVNGVTVASFTSSTANFIQRVGTAFDLAAGSSVTITFAGQSSTGSTSLIDDVRLVADDPAVTTYTYDALGRLTKVTNTGGVNDGVTSTYTMDKAGNRTNVTVTGSQQ